jgi:WD40 repeat protein
MDEKHVVTGSNDRTLVVWDRNRQHWAHILRGHTGQITCVGLHQSTVVSGSRDRTMRLWDLRSERELNCVSFSPEEQV